jgi:hypothetical protein
MTYLSNKKIYILFVLYNKFKNNFYLFIVMIYVMFDLIVIVNL